MHWQLALVMPPLVPALVMFLLVPVVSAEPNIDVFVFETQAARSLLFGLNPYDVTFSNVYGGSDLYPNGIPDSYPYPPLSLLFAILGLCPRGCTLGTDRLPHRGGGDAVCHGPPSAGVGNGSRRHGRPFFLHAPRTLCQRAGLD
ncbi:MAG: hypothetical protein O2782_01555 [bacterium]|nr:hypothetical protein [bacterium]